MTSDGTGRARYLRMHTLLVACLGCSLLPFGALAEPRPYRGPHPIEAGGDWHNDSDVHVHDDLPVGLTPFVEVDGVLIFLGDPQAYGYDGTIYRYAGAHPLPAAFGANCGITGEHQHPFVPEGSYRVDDGIYHFTGALRGGTPTRTPTRSVPTDRELEAGTPPATAYVVPVLPFGRRIGRPCSRVRGTAGSRGRRGCAGRPHRGRTFVAGGRRRAARASARRGRRGEGRRGRRQPRRDAATATMGGETGRRRLTPDAATRPGGRPPARGGLPRPRTTTPSRSPRRR